MFNWFKKKEEEFPEPKWKIKQFPLGFAIQEKHYSSYSQEYYYSFKEWVEDEENNGKESPLYYSTLEEAEKVLQIYMKPIVKYFNSDGTAHVKN